MTDDTIERMLLDIFRHWFGQDNKSALLNGKTDSESVIKRQEIFNSAKEIVKKHLASDKQHNSKR